MRIGYFGGSFDPPHRAHRAVALAAAETFGLDRVLLAPTGAQPLKRAGAHASWPDRMAMVRLLCADDPRLEVTDVDGPRPDGTPNYTVDTLERLHERLPDTEIFSLIGADSFLDMHRWREPARLLELAEWIVVARPGFDLDTVLGPNANGACPWTPEQRSRIHVLPTLDDPTSATAIRDRLRLGIAPGDALPAAVTLYISRMHLYH